MSMRVAALVRVVPAGCNPGRIDGRDAAPTVARLSRAAAEGRDVLR